MFRTLNLIHVLTSKITSSHSRTVYKTFNVSPDNMKSKYIGECSEILGVRFL